jgi:hypothetical protein
MRPEEVVMIVPARLSARDFVSTILDIVPTRPCHDDGVGCALRALSDYMIPATLMLAVCVAVGFVLAVSISVFSARTDARTRARPRIRLLSGPIQTDGTWVRLVEDQQGRRMVEVLRGVTWRVSTRDTSGFLLDVPVATRPRG